MLFRSDSRGGDSRGGGYDSRDSRGPPPSDRYDDRRGPPPSQPPVRGGSAWDQPAPPSQYGNLPPPPPPASQDSGPPGERKRKSRWGNERVEPGGMPTAITGGVEGKDLESYAGTPRLPCMWDRALTRFPTLAVQLRLDEIARALRTGLVVPPDGSRSPSPPPTYDGHGRRTNTREVRYRKKLEDERMRLVDRQMKNDPNFKPPTEYLMAKRGNNGRPTDKVYIPVKEFPEINFFGLLVGPRGNSLKKMERESGAKISIRGKGSVKEGKGRPGGGFDDDENEELHCLITGDSEEKVQRCVKLINGVIEIVRGYFQSFLASTALLTLIPRPRRCPKARTTTSATSSASLLSSTEPYVTTRTRSASAFISILTREILADSKRVLRNCGGQHSFPLHAKI